MVRLVYPVISASSTAWPSRPALCLAPFAVGHIHPEGYRVDGKVAHRPLKVDHRLVVVGVGAADLFIAVELNI